MVMQNTSFLAPSNTAERQQLRPVRAIAGSALGCRPWFIGGARRLARLGAFLPPHRTNVREGSGCPSMCRCRSTRSLWHPSKTHLAEQVGAPGLRPPLKHRRLGTAKSAGADFAWWLPLSSPSSPWGDGCLGGGGKTTACAVFALPHPQGAGGSLCCRYAI